MKKNTMTYFDRLMTAITFAEADLPDTSREFLQDVQTSTASKRIVAGQTVDRRLATHGVNAGLLKHS